MVNILDFKRKVTSYTYIGKRLDVVRLITLHYAVKFLLCVDLFHLPSASEMLVGEVSNELIIILTLNKIIFFERFVVSSYRQARCKELEIEDMRQIDTDKKPVNEKKRGQFVVR